MKYREREGLFDLDIYTDSHVAKQRVNKKRRKKPYDISVRPDLYEEVKRADEWLNAYKGKIDVKFRYSKYWGEIPADF
ncbi:MAG: hypothetical protein LBD75_03280 [Candidatus Peribacteria bacterium]|nr:hypothetical protein [Candidatus Peribacteria bacterium]